MPSVRGEAGASESGWRGRVRETSGLFRSLTQRLAGEDQESAWKPGLVEIEEALVPAFITERFEDGRFTVFVPSIPTPLAGAVYRLYPQSRTCASARRSVLDGGRWPLPPRAPHAPHDPEADGRARTTRQATVPPHVKLEGCTAAHSLAVWSAAPPISARNSKARHRDVACLARRGRNTSAATSRPAIANEPWHSTGPGRACPREGGGGAQSEDTLSHRDAACCDPIRSVGSSRRRLARFSCCRACAGSDPELVQRRG
jgi:hypothetical protein